MLPKIIPKRMPGAWQEWGGMYRCNAIGFANKEVTIFFPSIFSCKSMKTTSSDLLLKTHFSPLLFKQVWLASSGVRVVKPNANAIINKAMEIENNMEDIL